MAPGCGTRKGMRKAWLSVGTKDYVDQYHAQVAPTAVAGAGYGKIKCKAREGREAPNETPTQHLPQPVARLLIEFCADALVCRRRTAGPCRRPYRTARR